MSKYRHRIITIFTNWTQSDESSVIGCDDKESLNKKYKNTPFCDNSLYAERSEKTNLPSSE